MMQTSRQDFLKSTLAALGFAALPCGRIFAAPKGWKPQTKALLTLGVISDTHLRTLPTCGRIDPEWSSKYLDKALAHFRKANVNAVVHCGDFAHLGQTEEMQAHATAWKKAFPKNRAPAGHEVVKLFVTGNHEIYGATHGGGGGKFVKRLYPDLEEWKKHVLAIDLPQKWEEIWGEKYEAVWHKELNGFHFFGRNWGVDEIEFADFIDSAMAAPNIGNKSLLKPFFILRHDYPDYALRTRMRKYRNAVGLFGHLHYSIANWNKIYFADGMPWMQIPTLNSHGYPGLRESDPLVSKCKFEGMEEAGSVLARQGMIIRLYEDMMVIERHEFGEGGKLGSDWVMPYAWGEETNQFQNHPFSKEELKRVIGAPQFKKDAKLRVFKLAGTKGEKRKSANIKRNFQSIKLTIPLADANPQTRVYAYEVSISGEDTTFQKAVYAAGCCMGIGHEPNHGMTTLEIPEAELPLGEKLTIAVTPITSLGTRGKAIQSLLS